ncbi:UDP-2,4-diacetamido-2,4,6-trideoxy-beta-L-altropyranose hydrolase [Viridibacillus sp. FSL H7-0596]|uniref:UDP-2,4-diacetamido-2,4, 6-trideoxy-beta-L-altropyranose hydrolase n=1 Tax=Viridibacillus sp. FSL H7-0596 TaxID=1928923 RepID=UPI00096F769A|nr:UDP-2,4-diacetamido-2,4,6-trideoxy-beta-L-altropyranose hydrolase [Viridibacillus sp. FSL H7-0596]OMC89146.1 UDP-2,4-diacetamido-2,4,6-trideoxy-beta-L-altropyranose hydrolase [Viridibacillus sp. FSL H7-0596]
MQIFIRTDASIQIGSGHVMRCLTLAKQLKKNNVIVKFVCRNIEGNMIDYIAQQGFGVFTLTEVNTNSHWDWTREHWLEDAKETISVIQFEQNNVDMLIVDHYSMDLQWEQQLRPFVKNIMVIDDLADRKHDCDLLLDQNYYLNMEHRYKNLVPKDCIQFLGPNNALLRVEFLDINPAEISKDGSIKNILIFFGGSDSTGETLKALYALEKFMKKNITFNVVIGSANPFKEQIKFYCDQYDNINLHCNIDYMARLMTYADLAIGAGGTASWERIYLRLPAIVVILAKNQLELTAALAYTGAIQSIGETQNVSQLDIQEHVQLLINNPRIIRKMIGRCSSIINSSIMRENKLITQIMEFMK